MPTYALQTESGRTITLEAPDADTAMKGAAEWDKANPKPPPTEVGGQPVLDAAGTMGAGVLEGVPLVGPALVGGADRLVAGLRSMGLGGYKAQSYADELKHQQDLRKASNAAHPAAHVAGELTGGLAAGVMAAPFVASAGLIPASRIGQMAAGAASGAGVGGSDAAIRAEDGDRMRAAAIGALTGAAGGAAAPLVAAGASRVVNGIAGQMAQRGALSGSGVSPDAARMLMRHIDSPDAAANIAAAGPRGMLADAGQTARGMLDETIVRGGPGANQAARAVEGRAAGAGDDIQAALDRTMGPAESPVTMDSSARAAARPVNAANYERAYSKPIDYAGAEGQTLEGLLPRVPKAAITRANREMQIRGEKSAQIHLNENPDGSFTLSNPPDVRQWDYISRALAEEAKHGEGAGAMGGNTSMGSALTDLSRQVRRNLKAAVPEFRHASDTAKDSIDLKIARDFGGDLLKPGTDHGLVHETVDGMSRPEIEAVRAGVRAHIENVVSNVKSVAGSGNATDAREALKAWGEMSSRAARAKIGMILPREEAAHLFDTLDQAGQSLHLRASTAVNSRTAGRLAAKEGFEQATERGVIGKISAGEPWKAGKAAIQAVTGATDEALAASRDQVAAELARALTEHRGPDALRLMAQLRQANAVLARGSASAALIGRAGGGAAAGLLGRVGLPLTERRSDQ